MQPGDRKPATCRACHAPMLMILSVRGRWIPCEALPSKVDGVRSLVFANGQAGKRCGNYDGGHETHFAHCPQAARFKKPRPAAKKKEPKKVKVQEPGLFD